MHPTLLEGGASTPPWLHFPHSQFVIKVPFAPSADRLIAAASPVVSKVFPLVIFIFYAILIVLQPQHTLLLRLIGCHCDVAVIPIRFRFALKTPRLHTGIAFSTQALDGRPV